MQIAECKEEKDRLHDIIDEEIKRLKKDDQNNSKNIEDNVKCIWDNRIQILDNIEDIDTNPANRRHHKPADHQPVLSRVHIQLKQKC